MREGAATDRHAAAPHLPLLVATTQKSCCAYNWQESQAGQMLIHKKALWMAEKAAHMKRCVPCCPGKSDGRKKVPSHVVKPTFAMVAKTLDGWVDG